MFNPSFTLTINKMKILILNISLLFTSGAIAQENMHPSPPQTQPIEILGGTIHVGNGKIIENSTIRIENGKIASIRDGINANAQGNTRYINATGKQVYPGIIAPATNLGLVEVESVRSTFDFDELGDLNPNIRSIVAYNTDSKVINTLRSNGVLLANIVPQGGTISGSSSVVQLDAWNWEDAAYKTDNGIHFNMPVLINMPSQGGGPRRQRTEEVVDHVKQGLEKIESVRRFFREAQAYNTQATHPNVNLRYEAVKGLFDRSKLFFVHCALVKEMLVAIDMAKEFNFKLVLVDADESWMIADMLKANNVAVILHQPHGLPITEDDDVDQPYKTGAALQKAGVLFTICLDRGDGYWRQRDLPFQAGTMATYGLTKEEALSAITLNPAKILGIDDRTGSIEAGKDANIIISEGDLLDMKSSIVTHALIQGREIDLDNKQIQLYEKYKYKYGIKGK